jgi:hypothetical protein
MCCSAASQLTQRQAAAPALTAAAGSRGPRPRASRAATLTPPPHPPTAPPTHPPTHSPTLLPPCPHNRFSYRDKQAPYSVATNLAMGMQQHADEDLLLAAYNVPQVRATAAPLPARAAPVAPLRSTSPACLADRRSSTRRASTRHWS